MTRILLASHKIYTKFIVSKSLEVLEHTQLFLFIFSPGYISIFPIKYHNTIIFSLLNIVLPCLLLELNGNAVKLMWSTGAYSILIGIATN